MSVLTVDNVRSGLRRALWPVGGAVGGAVALWLLFSLAGSAAGSASAATMPAAHVTKPQVPDGSARPPAKRTDGYPGAKPLPKSKTKPNPNGACRSKKCRGGGSHGAKQGDTCRSKKGSSRKTGAPGKKHANSMTKTPRSASRW